MIPGSNNSRRMASGFVEGRGDRTYSSGNHERYRTLGLLRFFIILGAIFETNIMSNGSASFMKEHTTKFLHNGDPTENQIVSLRLFIVNDDDPKAAK